jgi:hypothetical protein
LPYGSGYVGDSAMTHRGNNNQRPGLTVLLLFLLLLVECVLITAKWFYGMHHWTITAVLYGLPGLAGILIALQPITDGAYRHY